MHFQLKNIEFCLIAIYSTRITAVVLMSFTSVRRVTTGRQHIRCATRRCLVVPRCRLSTHGPRAVFLGPARRFRTLPDSLRDPDFGRDNFRQSADVTSHAIVLWLQTLGPIEREGETVLVKP